MNPKQRERRTLHIIASFKLVKAFLLYVVAAAFLFLNQRSEIVAFIINWSEDELMLLHNRLLIWLLNRLDVALQQTSLGTTGWIALAYAIVLSIEGIGVWRELRWAEWLMVLATASLIPLECLHFVHKPSMVKVLIICANILIVVYLVLTLRRHGSAHESNDSAS